MLLYRDVISGDEMISDAFKITEVDDFAYEVDCRLMMGKKWKTSDNLPISLAFHVHSFLYLNAFYSSFFNHFIHHFYLEPLPAKSEWTEDSLTLLQTYFNIYF